MKILEVLCEKGYKENLQVQEMTDGFRNTENVLQKNMSLVLD